jgi:hypothetical protein
MVHHVDAAQRMTDGVFLGHADPAVQLDRPVRDTARIACDRDLGAVQVEPGILTLDIVGPPRPQPWPCFAPSPD